MAQAALLRAQNRASSKGSDPRVATCRGKLQSKRSKLNQEINKELRLRAGAENLFKATTNRKLKETVALELNFLNSNLQLLKEQLAELNSSVELYQGESLEPVMPMIPLGLKETKEIDFREPFKDFILEHYSEDGNKYENAISEFMNLRQAMRAPPRDASGISLLFQYYNQLYFIERRFFPPDRSLGIYFEWYDSLTGVPSCQRTVAFEKACVLFNMAAIYTQMGAKQDRLSNKGLDQAIDSFLRAAGIFTYIQENFMNAPSMDLAPHMMDMLIQLMLAQARECLFEKLQLQSKDKRDVDICIDLAQETSQVSNTYSKVIKLILVPTVQDYVPYSWVGLLQVKREHFIAIAHYYTAISLLSSSPSSKELTKLSTDNHTKHMIQLVNSKPAQHPNQNHFIAPVTEQQKKQLGIAHLQLALLFHEEAQRIYRMCRELRNKHFLAQVLAKSRENTAHAYDNTNEEDDFAEILDPLEVEPSSKFELSLTPADFSHLPVEDLFHSLGPVAVFSAKHHWTAPRNIQLQRSDNSGTGFGFSIRGDAPIIVAGVDPSSLAHFAGMKEGDFIVSINDKDVKWCQHDEVVDLIKDATEYLNLKLVTPMDRNYLHPKCRNSRSKSDDNEQCTSTNSIPSGSITTHRKSMWNPFRKQRQ